MSSLSARKIEVANFLVEHSFVGTGIKPPSDGAETDSPSDKLTAPKRFALRAMRVISRILYQLIMEFGAKGYPYDSLDFAPWPKIRKFVTDSQKFVIGMGPSYIRWAVRSVTGQRLKRPRALGEREPGENRFDARRWGEYLRHNGWKSVQSPSLGHLCFVDSGAHYVGVIPNRGTYGQVVWLITVVAGGSETFWIASTYENGRKTLLIIPASTESEVTWYREPKRTIFGKLFALAKRLRFN